MIYENYKKIGRNYDGIKLNGMDKNLLNLFDWLLNEDNTNGLVGYADFSFGVFVLIASKISGTILS